MSNFLGRFFQVFVVKKNWKHCSVRTEKLHRKKVKIYIFFGKYFFRGKNQFFLGLILFWNKSIIHRGPYSIVSVKVSAAEWCRVDMYVLHLGLLPVFLDNIDIPWCQPLGNSKDASWWLSKMDVWWLEGSATGLKKGFGRSTIPETYRKGAFTNYVYKRRGVGGQQNRLFVNFYTIENVNGGG